MLDRKPIRLVMLTALICATGCSSHTPTATVSAHNQAAIGAPDTRNKAARPYPFNPDNPIRFVGKPNDMGYGGVKRLTQDAEIPAGLSESDLKRVLRNAALSLYNKEFPDALAINARIWSPRGDVDQDGLAVATVEYAPNGRWADAHKSDPKKLVYRIGKAYSRAGEELTRDAYGASVVLQSKIQNKIELSKRMDDWSASMITARIRNGSQAVILDRRILIMSLDHVMVRYRVRAGSREGWIHGSAIKW